MKIVALCLVLGSSPAAAGALGDVFMDDDRDDTCSAVLSEMDYRQMFAPGEYDSLYYGMYRGLSTRNCGTSAIWEDFAARGFSDADLMGFVLDGSRIPNESQPAEVPLPASVWVMLSALLALGSLRGLCKRPAEV